MTEAIAIAACNDDKLLQLLLQQQGLILQQIAHQSLIINHKSRLYSCLQ